MSTPVSKEYHLSHGLETPNLNTSRYDSIYIMFMSPCILNVIQVSGLESLNPQQNYKFYQYRTSIISNLILTTHMQLMF